MPMKIGEIEKGISFLEDYDDRDDGNDGDREYPPSGRDGGVGGSQPHNVMPPYYVLAYIMKL